MISVNKILPGRHTKACLAESGYAAQAGIRYRRLSGYKKTRRREKLSAWCQTGGSSLHEKKRRNLHGSISFLWAFKVRINQGISTEPRSHHTCGSFPTPLLAAVLLILPSVDLFNVLIANSSGLHPTFLLFIGAWHEKNANRVTELLCLTHIVEPSSHLLGEATNVWASGL